MRKRVLSLFMALVFCFSLLPPAAFAEKTETEPITVQEQQEPNDSAAMQEQQEPTALPAAQSGTENEPVVQLAEHAAKIGPVQYSTLTDAFEAASMQMGAMIELLQDANLTDEAESLTVSGNITLNTCGFAIRSENANITIARNSKLTVENSKGTGIALNIPIFIENRVALPRHKSALESRSSLWRSRPFGGHEIHCKRGRRSGLAVGSDRIFHRT